MTPSPSQEAQTEAERLFPRGWIPNFATDGPETPFRAAFIAGAEWNGAQDAAFREEIRRIVRSHGLRVGQTTSGGYGILDELERALNATGEEEGEGNGE